MERSRLRILLVEDNPDDVLIFRELIEGIRGDPGYGYDPELTHVAGLSEARRLLDQGAVDAVLLDLSLPGTSGLETVRAMESYIQVVPVIVLTGLDDQRLALEAIGMGVQDFLVKGRISGDLVVRAVRYAMERHRMTAMLQGMAFLDDLTGLYNRRGFLKLAEHQIKLSRRRGRGFSLTYADLDGLKGINDNLGHAEGDAALQQAAGILRSTFRESDVIGRIGGDEFVALAIETDAPAEEVIRERLHAVMDAYNRRSGKPYRLSLSFGILHQDPEVDAPLSELIVKADALMYERKKSGR